MAIYDVQKKEQESNFNELFRTLKVLLESDHTLTVEIIGVNEVSILTNLKEKTIYTKVSRLELPALTRGRPLTFSRKEINLWMKLGKPTVSILEFMRRKGEIS